MPDQVVAVAPRPTVEQVGLDPQQGGEGRVDEREPLRRQCDLRAAAVVRIRVKASAR